MSTPDSESTSGVGALSPSLPNFFLIGAAKAGTTTLYDLLSRHPRIFLPRIKEPHFFSNDLAFENGIAWYARTHYSGAESFPARGDATPHYLFYEKAALRISEMLPESHHRFIVVLRDPVDRAYSLYWNMVHEGHESESFEDAIRLEAQRDTSQLELIGTVRHQYLASSLYAKQLSAWFQIFDRKRFLVILNDDLSRDAGLAVARVFDFLDLAHHDVSSGVSRSNRAGRPRSRRIQDFLRQPNRYRKLAGRLLPFHLKRSIATALLRLNRRPFDYPPMKAETRTWLRTYFRDDVKLLEEQIGRPLRHWYTDEAPRS